MVMAVITLMAMSYPIIILSVETVPQSRIFQCLQRQLKNFFILQMRTSKEPLKPAVPISMDSVKNVQKISIKLVITLAPYLIRIMGLFIYEGAFIASKILN